MDNVIKEFKKGNKVIKIFQDDSPESPRTWENVCKMVCFHNRYNLGDKHDYNLNDYESLEELKNAIVKKEKVAVIAPLYLYDHSGLIIKTGSFQGLLPQGHAEFDTSMIGFIFVTMETLNKEFGFKRRSKKAIEKAEEWIKIEVETYDQYLSGDIYGFQAIEIIESKGTNGKTYYNEENIDSCGGFYGIDFKTNGMVDYLPEGFEELILENCTE